MPYSYSMEIDGTKIESPIIDKIVYYSAPEIAIVMGRINFNDETIVELNKVIEWAGKTGEFNGKKYSDVTLKVELAGETLRTHTIKKAVPMGCAEIYTDQDGFGHFELALQASKSSSLYKYYWSTTKDGAIHIIYQIEPLSVMAIDNIANYSDNGNDDDDIDANSFFNFDQSKILVNFDAVRFNKPTIHGILDINLDVNQSSNLLGNTHREIYGKIGELIAGPLMIDESIIWTGNQKGIKKHKQDLVHRKIIRDKDIRVNIEEEKNFYGQLSNLKISICESFKGIYVDAQVETSESSSSAAPQANGGGNVDKRESKDNEINQLLQDAANKKTLEILASQSKTSAGPCLSEIYDPLTGKIAYGQNFKTSATGKAQYYQWLENDADPLIKNLVANYEAKIKNGEIILSEVADYRLAAHSEIVALDEILKNRRALGLPVDETTLSELYLLNIDLTKAYKTGEIVPKIRCEHCRYLTDGINILNHS